jgi:hypothetical protein
MSDVINAPSQQSELKAIARKALLETNNDVGQAKALFLRDLYDKPALLIELFSEEELKRSAEQSLTEHVAFVNQLVEIPKDQREQFLRERLVNDAGERDFEDRIKLFLTAAEDCEPAA